MFKKTQHAEYESLVELIQVISQLRDPINGCPWDIRQTHHSLIQYVLEEAYEVADAIRNGNDNAIKEELGDLLLQVIMHAQIAKDERRFSINDIAKKATAKLIRRHPHVFKNKKSISINEAKENWEKIKLAEKHIKITSTPISDDLQLKVKSKSSIDGALYISKEVTKMGFEWNSINAIWAKLDEEIGELKSALEMKDKQNAEEEIGDILFTLINLARFCQLNPEQGLVVSNQKFINRFKYIESRVNGKFKKIPLNRIKELWQKAKEQFKNNEI